MKVDGVSLNSVNFGDNQSDSNSNNQNNSENSNNNSNGNNTNNTNNTTNNETQTTDDIYMIIKIYNISKNDLKIDIYEKKNDQEEIYMTAVEMRKEDNRKSRSRYIRL